MFQTALWHLIMVQVQYELFLLCFELYDALYWTSHKYRKRRLLLFPVWFLGQQLCFFTMYLYRDSRLWDNLKKHSKKNRSWLDSPFFTATACLLSSCTRIDALQFPTFYVSRCFTTSPFERIFRFRLCAICLPYFCRLLSWITEHTILEDHRLLLMQPRRDLVNNLVI